jgi:hypothetical protein
MAVQKIEKAVTLFLAVHKLKTQQKKDYLEVNIVQCTFTPKTVSILL